MVKDDGRWFTTRKSYHVWMLDVNEYRLAGKAVLIDFHLVFVLEFSSHKMQKMRIPHLQSMLSAMRFHA